MNCYSIVKQGFYALVQQIAAMINANTEMKIRIWGQKTEDGIGEIADFDLVAPFNYKALNKYLRRGRLV